MKLLSIWTIVFLIYVCIVHPTTDYVGSQDDSQQPRNVQEAHSSIFSPHDDSVMTSYSTVPESQPMDEDGTKFCNLPNDVLNIMALRMHSDQDVKNLALSSRAFHYAPIVAVIRNIRRFCLVGGDRVYPDLRLAAPPTATCAESIIASNGQFHIQALYITEVPMTFVGAHSIASIIKHTDLRGLNLFECVFADEMILAISASLPQAKLTSLYLRDNNIGDEGARTIAAALPQSKLTSLDLELNEIGDEGAIAIAEALPESLLVSLNLRLNHIFFEGAISIAAALPESMLASLNLRFNDIGDSGACAIAAAFAQSELSLLNLGSNIIGAMGANAIAAALPLSKLTSLDLNDNHIGDEGAIAIAIALPNSKLMVLDLRYNGLTFLSVHELYIRVALMRRDNFRLINTQLF